MTEKIKRAQELKVPYMLVVGEKDMANGTVSPRLRSGEQLPAMPLEEFAQKLLREAAFPTKSSDAGKGGE
jgi:threonyl-tRNA synthetase